jgi:hypothetical protein
MTETQLEQTLYYAMLAIAIIPAIIISFIHENKRNKRPEMANTKPYTWGYYCGWIALIFGGEGIAMTLLSISMGEFDVAGYGLLSAGIMALGYGVIKRKGFAWIILIIISLNPICWIINGIYVKHRWSEFKAKDDLQKNIATATAPSSSKENAPNKVTTDSSETKKIPKLPPPLPTQTVSKNTRGKDYSI